MKSYHLIACLLLMALVACGQQGRQKESRSQLSQATETATMIVDADTVYAIAESLIDQPITVKGYATHVCSHSGMRCFMTGDAQKYSIRVEAKGDIGRFDQEQVGTLLTVEGILRERRLTPTEIADMEKDVAVRMQDEGADAETMETCETELANIHEMREWMEAQGKDYYSIYFIDGLRYHDATR